VRLGGRYTVWGYAGVKTLTGVKTRKCLRRRGRRVAKSMKVDRGLTWCERPRCVANEMVDLMWWGVKEPGQGAVGREGFTKTFSIWS